MSLPQDILDNAPNGATHYMTHSNLTNCYAFFDKETETFQSLDRERIYGVSWCNFQLSPKTPREECQSEKASRLNAGKPQLSYLLDAPIAMKGLAEVFAVGSEKYDRDNWKKGLDKDEIIDSLLRHLMAYKNGELVDSESGKCHTHHIHWNALVLAEQHSNK